MATELATAYVSLIPSLKGAQATIAKELTGPVTGAGEQAGAGFGGKFVAGVKKAAAPLAGLFAGAAVGSFLKDAVAGASDLSETVNKATTIFGDQSDTINKWASGAAKGVGLSQAAALEAAAGFGNMFSQLGFAGDQAAKMSTDVVGLSADLGSFNNLPTADVADRLSAAFRGEYDSLQALIPNINAARVEQQALADTGKASVSELTAQEKAAATLAIVQKDGALAAGDFAKTSGGLANSSKILGAQFEDLKARIGARLLPAMTGTVAFLSGTALPAFESFGGFLTGDLVPAVRDFGAFLAANRGTIAAVAAVIGTALLPVIVSLAVAQARAAATAVAAWATGSASAVRSSAVQVASHYRVVGGWVASSAAAVGAAARTVAAWVVMGAQSLVHAARMALAWVIAMGPVGWVIAAVVGLVALIVANWETVSAATAAAWTAVVSWVTTAWQNIVAWVTTAVNAVRAVVASVFAVIVGLIRMYVNAWRTVIATVWAAIVGVVRFYIGLVQSAIAGLATIVGKVREWFGQARQAVVDKLTEVVSFVGGIPGKVLAALGNLGSTLYSAGSDLIAGLSRGITDKVGAVVETVKGVAGKVAAGFKSVLGINSPSRVFAGFGENTADGYLLGLDRRRKAVDAGVRSLVAIPPTPPRVAGSVYAAPVNGAGAAGAGNGLTVAFNGNVGWDPDEVARRIDARQRDAAVLAGVSSLATVGV